jgi:hypothetical protein
MTQQRINLTLTELRCIAESDGSGASEPYLWTTFFAFPLSGPAGPVTVFTPSFDAFRTEFPDGIREGSVVGIPPFVASANFDLDLDPDPAIPTLVGCIAVLLEEDSTPQGSMIKGRIAYATEIEKQLNNLLISRIQSGNHGPITDAEIAAIKSAVESKAKSAIKNDQNPLAALFRDQDDVLGFTYKVFTHPAPEGSDPIAFAFFDFPQLGAGGNRFTLSGRISVGPVPKPPIDLCAGPRRALRAKQDEIADLQSTVVGLQQELQNASPSEKPELIRQIAEVRAQINDASAELPALKAALDACIARFDRLNDIHGSVVVGGTLAGGGSPSPVGPRGTVGGSAPVIVGGRLNRAEE